LSLLPVAHSLLTAKYRGASGLNTNSALPHVTLVQFDALDVPQSNFLRKVCRRPSIEISFDTIYFQSGTGEHKGYVWTGLGVCRNRELIEDQRRVVASLRAENFVTWTDTDDLYFPHLTLARLVEPPAGAPVPWAINWPAADLQPCTHPFDLALGLSDSNGVLTQILYRCRAKKERKTPGAAHHDGGQ
jgi:hypothetical protein